jgi:hypothetical protein
VKEDCDAAFLDDDVLGKVPPQGGGSPGIVPSLQPMKENGKVVFHAESAGFEHHQRPQAAESAVRLRRARLDTAWYMALSFPNRIVPADSGV